ncbi:hypothetical protein ACEPAG_2919 [Sanghuangporus baumii]
MSNSASQHLGVLSVRSDPGPIDPNEVSLWVSEKAVDQYFQAAIVTVLVYDALITLDKEAKYFWKVPRRAVDYVYFLNRYIGIFGSVAFLFWNVYGVDIAMSVYQFSPRPRETKRSFIEPPRKSPEKPITPGAAVGTERRVRGAPGGLGGSTSGEVLLGNFAEWTRNIANWVTIISIDYILMIRVVALYSQNTRLSICLNLLLMLEAVVKLALLIYLELIEHIVVIGLAKNVMVSGEDNEPPWQLGMVDWLIPMAYGAILMILALYNAVEPWKISAGFKGFVLVKVLVRDQALYFILVIACCIFNIIEFWVVFSNELLAGILAALGNPAFLTILGNRMLFNLKEAGERGQNEGTSYRVPSRTISDIDFAEPARPQGESETRIEGDDGQA